MKKIVLTVLVCLSTFGLVQAQYGMDFGLNLGGANYTGEIGGNGDEARPWLLDTKFGATRFAVGGFYRYSFSRNLSVKLSANYARISGADSNSVSKSQIGRNLSFRTDIIEAIITGEYTFFALNDISRSSSVRADFSAYVFAGAGVALYYPYAQFDNKWYYLRPLNTEGTENAYDEMAIVVPLGAGAHFTFNKKFRLGIEFGYRFTNTDYLDDVSTKFAYDPRFPDESSNLPFEESKIFANRSDEAFARGEAGLPDRGFYSKGSIRGNPDTNDGYILGQFSFSYVISNKNSFYKSKYNSIINRRRKRTKF